MRKLFSYMGSKRRHLDDINRIINSMNLPDGMTYVEPFVGSGVVFLNLEKQFKDYLLFDKYDDLISFYNLQASPEEFNEALMSVVDIADLLDIENHRDNFMWFRDELYAKETDPLIRACLFFIVISLTMNNQPSFNGQNLRNGYGGSFNGKYKGNKYSNKVEETKEAYAFIKTKDVYGFSTGFDYFPRKNAFYFVDPPYFKANMRTGWKEEDTATLIDWLIRSKAPFLYTDMESHHTQRLIEETGAKFELFTKINSTVAPNKVNSKPIEEVFVYKGV